MATTPTPNPSIAPYQYYSPYAQNAGYNTSQNPRQAATNEAEFAVNTGGQLLNQQQQLADYYGQQQAGTENYLNPLEETNAQGGGGYTPEQAAQIQLNPAQQQNIVTGAGISSGVGTASAVGAADRAAAASGGNPAAMATYRARAAQTQGAQAGDAETQARIAAQQAGSAGAQAVGNAQLAQENQGLQYLGNLQSEQGTQATTEQGLGNQSFGTEVQGLQGGTGNEVGAAGIPTTADKIIGGIAGVATGAAQGGAFNSLADGTGPNYLAGNDGGQDAVVAEDGPEAIIPGPEDIVHAASDPVRSHTTFMDNGTAGGGGTAPMPGGMPAWLQAILTKQNGQPSASQPGQQGWNKTTPYGQIGTAIGRAIARPVANWIHPQHGTTGAGSGGGFGGMSPQAGSETTIDPGNLTDEGGSYLAGTAGSIGDAGAGLADAGAEGISDIGGAFADGRPSYLAGGRMSSGFHWGMPRPRAPHMPAGGYTPLNHNPRMMADGNAPEAPSFNPSAVQTPMQAQPSMQPDAGQKPQIITKPTLVHLEREDMVVPLSYRPKAKVRPSAAMAAMQPQMGGYRARA